MIIKMLKTIPGSIDGVTVIELQAGTEYTMTDSARGRRRAAAYFRRGEAVELAAVVVEAVPMLAVAGKARRRK